MNVGETAPQTKVDPKSFTTKQSQVLNLTAGQRGSRDLEGRAKLHYNKVKTTERACSALVSFGLCCRDVLERSLTDHGLKVRVEAEGIHFSVGLCTEQAD